MSHFQFLPRLRGATTARAARSIHQLRTIQTPFLAIFPFKRPYSSSAAPKVQTQNQRQRQTRFKPADRLSGRTCMITGATSGIGYAIADRFLQEGAKRIILVGRSDKRLVDAAARLGGDLEGIGDGNGSDEVATRAPEEDQQQSTETEWSEDGRISLLVGDVSESGAWLREFEEKMRDVDILVNAAGISTSHILARTDPDAISQTLRTNLEGAIITSRALLRAAIRNRSKSRDTGIPSKCIINVSSLLAHKGGTGAVPYAASKAGVLGLTRSLAVEAASSLRSVAIRSNAIVPGYIDTPMIADFSESEKTRLQNEIPLGRFGDPQEVADAAVFLAQNEYANNCILNLDGGLSAV